MATQRVITPDLPAKTAGAETKAAIYRAAVDLFSARGYAATSMRGISAAVGVEPASVYNHYSSKEEILYTIILRSTQDSIAFIEEHVAQAEDSPAQRLRAATKAHVVFHCRNHKTAHIGWSDLHFLGPGNLAEVTVARDYYEGIFRTELLAGIECGEFIDTNPTLTINGIIGIGSRCAVWFRADGPKTDTEVGEFYGDLVLRALTK